MELGGVFRLFWGSLLELWRFQDVLGFDIGIVGFWGSSIGSVGVLGSFGVQ